jgi:acetyltransferase-like isoleucine patch superfamily enzyme
LKALLIRLLQVVALYVPGAMSVRVRLHRLRGVRIGSDVFIGADALLETARPDLIWIGDRVVIGIRSTVIAHFRGVTPAERGDPSSPFSVRFENDVFLGPGTIVLPGVTLGEGSVVAAGSVVTASVDPLTLVQGNPARPVARCGVPLGISTSPAEFARRLRPIRTSDAKPSG